MDPRNEDASESDGSDLYLGKRNQIEILLEMLSACQQPVRKTHLLYMARINHYQLESYIEMLKKFGMIEDISQPFKGFLITRKGRTLVRVLTEPPA